MMFKKTTISAIILLVGLATIIGLSGLSFIMPDITQKDADNISENPRSNLREPVLEKMENFFLTTKDNKKISTNIYKAENPIGWIIFAHMMPSTKESWHDLAVKLQSLGYESLAIDLRGHGESDDGPDGFIDFSDDEHQKSILDLQTAVDYLKIRGASPEKISFIGASIGANLSLQYISENSGFNTALLLSPGLNYKGIKTEQMIMELKADKKILFVSSRDDGPNTEENQTLFNLMPAETEKDLIIYKNAGHGTNMFGKEEPDLESTIIKFLK